jgi:predicted RNA-binding protein with PUA-like domain
MRDGSIYGVNRRAGRSKQARETRFRSEANIAKPRQSWLFKEEPSCYSYADLERDKTTVWSGIKNALALKNLREVRAGDRVLFYHTGKEKAVVGEMRVLAGCEEGAEPAVTVEAVRRWPKPVTLAMVKADPQLQGWDLVRLPRLSVVRVGQKEWDRLAELSRTDSE